MSLATLTSKGQVTIPVAVRNATGLAPGSRMDFVVVDDETIIVHTRVPALADLFGSLGSSGVKVDLDDMDEAIGQAMAGAL